MNRELFLSYAQEFVSFLIRTLEKDLLDEIQLIILFGSSVRGEATRKSDVDLFIDVAHRENEIDEQLVRITEDFYALAGEKWKQMRVDNPISLKVGRLSEWKALQPAIVTDGLVLYGKYKPEFFEGKHRVIFSWTNTRLSESQRIMVNRTLYGYNRLGTRYPGLLQQYGGEKMSPGSIMVPVDHLKAFEEVFRKYRIAVRIFQVVSY